MPIFVDAFSTLRELPPLDFPHELQKRYGRGDPLLAKHTQQLIHYVMQSPDGKISQRQYHLYRHFQRSRHELKLQVEPADMEQFALWSDSANAIAYLPDGSIRDPQGRVLLDESDSPPDPEAAIPYPPDARERKARSVAEIAAKEIATPDTLPPVVGESEVEFPPASEVARRMLALFVVALRAESLASGEEIPADELKERIPLGYQSLTPKELAFVEAPAPEKQAIIEAAWRYESLETLQWALGDVEALSFPTAICDVPSVARTALALNHEQFVEQAQLRPAAEILDTLDLTFRLHWAARQAHHTQSAPPAGVLLGVLFERHHALNWLTGFEDAKWDDVDTPT